MPVANSGSAAGKGTSEIVVFMIFGGETAPKLVKGPFGLAIVPLRVAN
jgi:hypothetical protein